MYHNKHNTKFTQATTTNTTTTTTLWPTCIGQYPQLKSGGFCWSFTAAQVPLLMGTELAHSD